MPPLFDAQHARIVEAGPGAFGLIRVLRLRVGGVYLAQPLDVAAQLPRHPADAVRKMGKNALDLLLFRRRKLAQLVIHVQYLLRLDEEGRAARRAVVHEAADPPLMLGAHGQNVAVVTHGDDRVLQIFCALAAQVLAQLCADALVKGSDGAAYVEQRVARIVAHLVLAKDLVGDVALERFVEIDARRDLAQARRTLFGQTLHRAVRDACGTQQRRRGEKLCTGEGRALLCAVQLVALGRKALDAPDAVAEERGVRLGGQLLQRHNFLQIAARLRGADVILRLFQHGIARDAREHFIQF